MDLDKTIKELSQNEKKVLLTLQKLKGQASPEEILKKGNFNKEVEVMNASSWLQSKKLVKIEDHIKTVYFLGKEGRQFLEKGFPEKIALKLLNEKRGKIGLKALSNVLSKPDIPVAIGWLKKKKWATIKKDKDTIFEITDIGKKAVKIETDEEKILKKLKEKPNIELDKEKIKFPLSRKNVIKEKDVITSTIILTDIGKKIIQKGIKIEEEISQITTSIIKSGDWKNKTIRPYDINAFAPAIYGGKPHPLVDLISKIKQIFLELGFEDFGAFGLIFNSLSPTLKESAKNDLG